MSCVKSTCFNWIQFSIKRGETISKVYVHVLSDFSPFVVKLVALGVVNMCKGPVKIAKFLTYRLVERLIVIFACILSI